MLTVFHWLLVATYILLPAAAVVWAVFGGLRRWRAVLGVFTAACILSIGINIFYAEAVGGRPMAGEVAQMAYFGAGLLLMLRVFDFLLIRSLRRVLFLRPPVMRSARPRVLLAAVVRAGVLVAVVLPFVMSAVMVYRPKVRLIENPTSMLAWNYEEVSFESTDGVRISGWWIPSDPNQARNSDRTVIVCHGLGANKANQLVVARLLHGGYNLLAIDLRAHGRSGGNITTVGSDERYDVLGAVRWLRANRAAQTRKIFGVGASLGAAALVAAAADASEEGQAIDALALYGTFDDLGALARSLTQQYVPKPIGFLLRRVMLPLADVHAGVRLESFRPAELIPFVWPRPVVILHGQQDEIIPFNHGRVLFNAALQPKHALWIPEGNHNDIINNEDAAKAVKRFFDTAEPFPVL